MFFYTKVNNVETRVDVTHYDNGSTCVTCLIDDSLYELSSIAQVKNKFTYTSFLTNNNLKDVQMPCLKRKADVETLTGNKFQQYEIDFNAVRVFSPSEFVQQLMNDNLLPKSQAQKQLGISHMTLHRIINQDDNITIPMALKFGRFFNVDPQLFIELQQNFDLIKALTNQNFLLQLNEIQTLAK